MEKIENSSINISSAGWNNDVRLLLALVLGVLVSLSWYRTADQPLSSQVISALFGRTADTNLPRRERRLLGQRQARVSRLA